MSRGQLVLEEYLDSFWGIRAVWLRYFDVFRKSIVYYLMTTFIEPFLYILSFGFGLGSLVGTIHAGSVELSYRRFIFSGIIGQTILFQGFFEAAYGGFIRMYYQKIFQSMGMTPITLSEVLWGELIWDATKATVSSMAVVVIGVLMRQFPWTCLFTLPPLCFVGGLLFAAMGLTVAGISKNIEQISYPQYLLVFPMFLFCGVFYPISTLPEVARWVAWALPLTSIISLIRTLTLGFPFEPLAIPVLAIWTVGLVILSRSTMIKRLIK
jgi:lipooligosaccharide transport system permease protein